jgi:hypothetical protein
VFAGHVWQEDPLAKQVVQPAEQVVQELFVLLAGLTVLPGQAEQVWLLRK